MRESPTHKSSGQKQQRARSDHLIGGIDALIADAEQAGMGMAARILYAAKEELVHWAVTMNFHESPQDRFINRHLYDRRAGRAKTAASR